MNGDKLHSDLPFPVSFERSKLRCASTAILQDCLLATMIHFVFRLESRLHDDSLVMILQC